MNDYFEANKNLWDAKAEIHKDSKFYDVDGFLKGNEPLDTIVIDEIGDVTQKSILHLQCHIGLDTMSWERKGANAVGVDFSGEAVKIAHSIAQQANLRTRFIESNIYDLPEVLDEKFDIVFVSEGSIMWLNDLKRWADVIYRFLKPGGFFYIWEFHPFGYVFEDECEEPVLKVRYPYFQGSDPIIYISDVTYTDSETKLEPKQAYEWNHGIAEVINSLTNAGLYIEFFNEFPFATYKALPFMVKNKEGRYVLPEGMQPLPFMYSLKASKPATPNSE